MPSCGECDIVCCGQYMRNLGKKKTTAPKKTAKPAKKKTAKKK